MASLRDSLLLTTDDLELLVNSVSKLAPVEGEPEFRKGVLKLLDTFDWALDRSEMSLKLHETNNSAQLVFSEPSFYLISEMPFSNSNWLSPGSFEDPFLSRRLPQVTSDRALIVQAATAADSCQFKLYNAEGMDASTVWLYRLPEIDQCSVLLISKRGYESFHQKIRRSLLDAFEELNLGVNNGDPFEIILNKHGRSKRDYQTKFSLEVDRSTYGCIALGQALASEELRAQRNAAWLKEHPDPEFLHDFRVAMRRSSSFIKSLGSLLAPLDTAWFRTELKLFINTTSPIRDLENLGALAERQLERDPNNAALRGFSSRIAKDVSKGYADLSDLVPSSRFEHLLSTWDRLARQCLSLSLITSPPPGKNYFNYGKNHDPAITPKTKLSDSAKALLLKSGVSLIKRAKKTKRNMTAESLHRLRKEVKTFRYLLEFFEPVLEPVRTREVIIRIKRLQDALGQHQDSVVQLQLLARLCEKYQVDQQGVSVLFQVLEHDQQSSIESYAKEIKMFSGASLLREIQLATAHRKK
ncbi:MAG: CHAD domain-containing protein [Actinomycetota bacterium]|nr:MAG: CHAD domain-containing protein [Actinomycetota bacterium]